MYQRFYALLSFCLLAMSQLWGQTVVNITDNDIQAGQTYNWTNDKVYVLDGLVFVEPGARLNIQAGTVVKFTDRADLGNPSALVITRGATIYAEGTAEAPIIFTAVSDDVNDPYDLGPTDGGLWGGIVLLGNGITQKNGNSEVSVEGISTAEPRGLYGGTNNADNSGVLRYVSIRHGGRQIASGSELNGLTLGAVGSGTTLEYVEVYANTDDGIEFFGGAPNLKYAVVAFVEDDCYDWDEAYVGQGQFWFSIQRPDIADAGGELDGSTPDDLTPYSNPTVFNWTHIGSGAGATASNPVGLLFRAGTAGIVANSIVTEMKNKAIEVQDKNTGTNDAHQKLLSGELQILSNVFWANGANTNIDGTSAGIIRITSGQPTQDDPTGATLIAELIDNNSAIANPAIRSVSRDQDNGLDPRPSQNGAAYAANLAAYPSNSFFTPVDYRGAFSADLEGNWLAGWTTLSRNGHLTPATETVVDCSTPATQTVQVTDNDIVAGQTYNWTNDNVYVLDGLVFVEPGATLNIEAGTVVKFTDRADLGNPSALVVTRGAKIYAEGTAECPITFTAVSDDVADPLDLGPTDGGLWGGIVLLGSGITQKNGNSEVSVEGISTAEPRGLYGGTNNADNSGVLRYVSIRHGGRQIASGSELNGLTLGAVGSGTTLEYVEVYANTDDGIEFFGGAPNLKYAVVAFVEDDCYDWDEAYVGKGQFWFSIQRPDIADAGGELDGSTPDDLTPYSNPTVFNWTHIGSGPGAAASNPVGLLFRAGTAGIVANSIVTEMKNKAIEVQDKNAGTNDAHQKLLSGELQVLSNVFWANGANTTIDGTSTGIIRITSGQPTQDDPNATALIAELIDNNSAIANPELLSISRAQDNLLDPRPNAGGAAFAGNLADYPNDVFFTEVSYRGAFGSNESDNWLKGWSTLDRNNHLGSAPAADCSTPPTQTVEINDNSIQAGQTYNWTNDKVYVLDGLVFVEPGATLNIEAGTVVKFTDRADLGNPSALVVTRGAKIYAEGTAECPIIFTAVADDVNEPLDLGPTDGGLWGGIVLLGNGITQKNGNSEVSVEGISTAEPRGLYGGTNNADNSGVLRYVSIRHGGRQIASGSELNGLTLGAVGSATTLEYVEVYANTDDGIEFFGGAPNLKYAIVAFVEDDCYDWDEAYVGQGQFWFSIQRPDIADAGGELDGSTPDDLTPYSNPTVFNWTHIGSGPGAAASNPVGLLFRAGTAGIVANSIVTEMKNKAIEVQDKNAGTNDAHQKLLSGELQILSNVFWANGANTTIDGTSTGIIRITSGQPTQDDPTASALIAELVDNGSSIANPEISSISREQDRQLDPRPSANGAAYAGSLATYPAGNAFFTPVDYRGAFSADENNLWIRDWSTLWRNEHADIVVGTREVADQSILGNFKIFPNPTTSESGMTIETKFEEAGFVTIYTLDGRLVRQVQIIGAGLSRANIGGLQNGMYVVKFTTEGGRFASRLLVVE